MYSKSGMKQESVFKVQNSNVGPLQNQKLKEKQSQLINVSVTFNEKHQSLKSGVDQYSSQNTSQRVASVVDNDSKTTPPYGKASMGERNSSAAMLATQASPLGATSQRKKNLMDQRSTVIFTANRQRNIKILSHLNENTKKAIES